MLAMLCGLLVVPPGAGAATIFGSNLLGEINWEACASETEVLSCTYANGDLPPASQAEGGASAPAAGVITSWRVKAGDSEVGTLQRRLRLRLLRGNTGVGTGPLEFLPLAAGIYSYPVRLPVAAGDRLGLDFPNVGVDEPVPVIAATPGTPLPYWIPLLGEGVDVPPDGADPSEELLVQATLEADGDGDGFGDETQDKCPGTTDLTNACSPAIAPVGPPLGPIPTEPIPNTKIGKRPRGTIAVDRATFRFSATVAGATFRCKLDRKPFKACKSPRTYRNLKAGQHTFKVRATGPTAVPDPTPAKRAFKVEL